MKKVPSPKLQSNDNNGNGQDTQPLPTAWWLAAGRHRPEWQSLRAAGMATFSGRPRAYFQAAQPGDLVLLYLARPDHTIRAVGVVGQATVNGSTEPSMEVQYAFEIPGGLTWREIESAASLRQAEPVRRRSSGNLFALTPEEYLTLKELIIERNPELDAAFAAVESGKIPPGKGEAEEQEERAEAGAASILRETSPVYIPAIKPETQQASGLPPVNTLSELEKLTKLPIPTLKEACDLLVEAGQVVLSGPPGTGKTWLARGLAALVAGDPSRVQVVQFHPATAYEDFIEGLKPRVDAWGHVTYAVMPGLFVRMCQRAKLDPQHSYVLIVDEINRAPLARVFGELLYALEYRGPDGAVELSVSAGMEHPAQPFYVPKNLLILGTMNSADRSLALVDYALRRRFRFLEMEPDPTVLDRWLMEHGSSARVRRVALDLFAEVNKRLAEALDPDHRLGQSYFMLDPFTAPMLDRTWRTSIKPLLSEYFVPPAGEIEEYATLFAEAVEELGA